MKVYLCWSSLDDESPILTGAFQDYESAKHWKNYDQKHPNSIIQEINVTIKEKKDKEFEKLQKHWKSLE